MFYSRHIDMILIKMLFRIDNYSILYQFWNTFGKRWTNISIELIKFMKNGRFVWCKASIS